MVNTTVEPTAVTRVMENTIVGLTAAIKAMEIITAKVMVKCIYRMAATVQ
jgi:hypothetical protein